MTDEWEEPFGPEYRAARAEARRKLLMHTEADLMWALEQARGITGDVWDVTPHLLQITQMYLEQLRCNKLGI